MTASAKTTGAPATRTFIIVVVHLSEFTTHTFIVRPGGRDTGSRSLSAPVAAEFLVPLLLFLGRRGDVAGLLACVILFFFATSLILSSTKEWKENRRTRRMSIRSNEIRYNETNNET